MLSAGEVHKEISELAAEKANRLVEADPILSAHIVGLSNIFHSTADYSRYRNSVEAGISISYEQDRVDSFDNAAELHPRLQAIGRRATTAAVHDSAGSIVALIVGEAREGNDYFEKHFKET